MFITQIKQMRVYGYFQVLNRPIHYKWTYFNISLHNEGRVNRIMAFVQYSVDKS